jgi:hypothetical protein
MCGKEFETKIAKSNILRYSKEVYKIMYYDIVPESPVSPHLCDSCKKDKNARRLTQRQQEMNDRRQATINRAKVCIESELPAYINAYLNPECTWKPDTKINVKFNEINKIVFWPNERDIEDAIADYIKNMPYKSFLSTPYWKAIADYVKMKANFKCTLCASTSNINTHHKTYARHGYEHVYWKDDLICLCQTCHQRHHNILTEPA